MQVDDIAVVRIILGQGCLLAAFYSLFVLFLSLALLLHNALGSLTAEGCDKPIDAGVGVDRKAVLQFKVLVSGILVGLDQSDVCHSIYNFNLIFR